MTQPNGAQPQLQLLVCPDCGSVRMPVPAIVSKVVTLSMQQSVVPCPVCRLVLELVKEHEGHTTWPDEPRVRLIHGDEPA